MNRLFFISGLFILVLIAALTDYASAATTKKADKPEIIERIIRIEGTIEKPRVLFIVPRARLWRKDMGLKKNFTVEMLKPEYPESLIKSQ